MNVQTDNNIHDTLFSMLINHQSKLFYDTFEKNSDIIDVNICDSKNNYFLTYAIIMNKLDIVKFLLDKGAKIDITDNENRSIAYYAIILQYNDIVDILLEYNKKTIGISLFHCKDNNGKTLLNYSIESKNIYAIKSILESKANPNDKNNDGDNCFHQSIYTKNKEIVNLVTKYVNDINIPTSTGETALHISTNFQLEDICNILLKQKADPNVQEFNYEFTPLHYATTLGNRNITQMLLTFDADPNKQDIYGNTPLHYAISYENFSCINEIINFKYSNYVLNYNLWNIKAMIPIHIFFLKYSDNYIHYLDKFIEKSNMAIKNSDGNNLLHYLAINDIWKNYKTQISQKKLDLFSRNKDGKSVLDYVKKDDFQEFINIAGSSYVNRLKRHSGNWIEEFDQVCSLEYGQLSNAQIKKLESTKNKGNIIDNKSLEKVCIDIAEKKIVEKWKNMKDGKMVCDISGKLKNTCEVKINGNKLVNFCTYTGSTLDVLIGLLYLLQKHTISCSTLSKNFINNNELCRFYKSLGIVMNNKCEFLNFEIVWIQYKLYIMESFHDTFNKCIKKNKRFIIIPVGIEMKNGNHANYIIYDSKINEIERFEPHGTTGPIGLNYRPELLDDVLEKKFKQINKDVKYIRPSAYLPKIGFQLFDNNEKNNKKIGDPGGFCALWSMWYVDMRLTYPDIDRKTLVKNLIKTITTTNSSFKDVIRNYSDDIVSLRDEMLQYAKMDVNDWMNDNYTEKQLEIFIENIRLTLSKVIA
jgi:ankyrin repeat protein